MNSGNQTLLLELSIESDIESKLEQRVTGEKSPAFGMWSYTDLYRDRTILNKWTTPSVSRSYDVFSFTEKGTSGDNVQS